MDEDAQAMMAVAEESAEVEAATVVAGGRWDRMRMTSYSVCGMS